MFIRVRDQTGSPPPKCGHGIRERLWVALIPDGSDGTPKGDRFTDDNGQCGVEGFEQVYGSKGCTLAVNEANVNPNYNSVRVHVADVEAAVIDIVVTRLTLLADAIQGYGSCAQWKDAVFNIFAKHGYSSCGPEYAGGVQAPYLRATQAEIQALHSSPFVRWQYTTGATPDLRPRLFLPHGGSDPFARYADLGDWLGPLKWDHCQDAAAKTRAAVWEEGLPIDRRDGDDERR